MGTKPDIAVIPGAVAGGGLPNLQAILLTLLLGFVALLVVTPLAWTLFSSFVLSKPWEPVVYGLDGWREAFTSPGILESIYYTFSLAVTRQLIALFFGVLLAWVLARTDIPGKGWLEFMFWLSFFMPALPGTLGWILAFDPKAGIVNGWLRNLAFIDGPVFNIYSFWGIVWTHLTTSALGIKVMLLTPAFRNMDAALEEASRSAGASMATTLRRVVIPVMAPAILVTTILGLIRALEAFEIELILGVRVGIEVYSTKIHHMIEADPFGEMAAASALGSFVLLFLLVLVVLNKSYIGGREYTTVTGRFSSRILSLGRWRYPLFFVVLAVVLLITFIPMGFLLMGTFMSVFGFFDIPDPWTLNHWRAVLDDARFLRALGNTFVVGLGSSAVGVIFCSLLGYIIVRSRFTGRAVLDFISWLPWSIPGILLGFGLLWTFLNTPLLKTLHGTTYLLMIAIIIKSMPFGVQFMKTITLQLGNELEEASRVCGGSWLRTYVRIVLPLSLPMLLVVALLIFNSAARDISTLILLGSANSKTLSLLMLDWLTGSASTEKAMVVGVIIVVLVILTAVVARALGGRTVIRS